MTGRYGFGSVDVEVEAGKVHVPDLFVSLATMVQFDVTFPHFHNVVTFAFQVLDLCHGAVVKFLHGFAVDRIHGIAGVTSRTSVPETAVDFVCVSSW